MYDFGFERISAWIKILLAVASSTLYTSNLHSTTFYSKLIFNCQWITKKKCFKFWKWNQHKLYLCLNEEEFLLIILRQRPSTLTVKTWLNVSLLLCLPIGDCIQSYRAMAIENIHFHFLGQWNHVCRFVYWFSYHEMALSEQRNELKAAWKFLSSKLAANRKIIKYVKLMWISKYKYELHYPYLVSKPSIIDRVWITLSIINTRFNNPLMIESSETRSLIE